MNDVRLDRDVWQGLLDRKNAERDDLRLIEKYERLGKEPPFPLTRARVEAEIAQINAKLHELYHDAELRVERGRGLAALEERMRSEFAADKTQRRSNVILTASEAARSRGLSVEAFRGRVKRRSEGFAHLRNPENRGPGGRGYKASAVMKCPRTGDADPEYLRAATRDLAEIQAAKREFSRINSRD